MKVRSLFLFLVSGVLGVALIGCAEVSVPDARNVNIPNPVAAEKRKEAVNERPDSVMYLPLGEDVLVPERIVGQNLPQEIVGPFELRSETLAGALQLILADYDISIAFETDQGLTKKVTVANLKGPLDKVVSRVCSLADLYCSYEDGALVVKDTQTFTVSLPPLGDAEGGQEFITDVISGLSAVIGSSGSTPVSDPTTRTLIYSATQRTSKLAENYFERLRANTAMIVFETYIWEVSLNSGNSTGIDWAELETFGKFNTSIGVNGSVSADFTNPISIGLPTTETIGANPAKLIEFLAQFGAVKTISQPQITVLSGASAELRVADTENYVSEVTSTISGDNTTTSVSTDSVDSGFTLTIGSSWDKSTVYANVNINLTNVDQIEDFTFSDSGAGGTDTIIQLPQTTERELTTQIRVRPGDSVLIAGLVRERDNFDSSGPGFMEPVIPSSRTAQTDNLELVILLRPRVIVYTAPDNKHYQNFVNNKAEEFLKSAVSRRAEIPQPVIREPIPSPVVRQPDPTPVLPEPSPVYEKPVIRESVVEIKESAPLSEPPSVVEVERVESPSPIVYEQPIQPVYKAPEPAYQKAIEVTESVSVSEPEFETPVQAVVEPIPTVPYEPSYSSGYRPGYVSGRVYDSYEESVSPAQSYISPSYPVRASTPVYKQPEVVIDSDVSSSPLSADIYNRAQPLNVYEVYEQNQQNQ